MAIVARGLAVFPLPPGGKVPVIKNWPDRCVSDPAIIARCWRNGDNIGVGCKANGLLGIDLDRHHAQADGVAAFSQLCERHGQEWPATLTVRTPSKGLHLYFRAPRERALGNSSGKLGPGIDTRGPGAGSKGGYLVAAGSLVDGVPYEIARDLPIAELPGWLTELLDPPAAEPRPVGPLPTVDNRYALKALHGEVQRILDTPKGGPGQLGRNDQLNRSAYALGQLVAAGLLNQLTAEVALRAAADAVGLMNDDGPRQVEATIQSGLNAGFRKPRNVRVAQ
ncbi:bifunctional DNA primase/polymerase [Nonomuraea polychroma]|uniref:bifunctional DNA primase/polymerase n=1 Tax=Nonomuraea polychroma TaxID=46176 RepID=UPI003D8A60CD